MRDKKVSWILFTIILICDLAAGFYICHIKHIVFGDAISRVANAFYVIYIQPPHLAAIGAVWNPLPSLLELPLMLLWPIYKPIATSGLAGVLMTSVFNAASGVLIFKNAIDFGRSRFVGLILALLYCFNPFVFIYGFNGMTEVPFSFMLLLFTFNFIKWMENENPSHIVSMAVALALAFLIRYEAIPVSICASLIVTIIILKVHRKKLVEEYRLSLKYSLQKAEGKNFVLISPVFYTFLIWVLFCWIIMGDPLYFLNSEYSISAFGRGYAVDPVLKKLIGNSWMTLQYVFLKTRVFLIPLIVIIGYRIIKRQIFKWDFLVLLILILSTNILQFVDLRKGLSAGWWRYFLYPFPFILAWIPYELKKMNSKLFTGLCIVSLIILNVSVGFAWFSNTIAPEEYKDLSFKTLSPKEETQREIAKFINVEIPHATILMDCVWTYNVIMNVTHPENLVVSCSYQFKKAVENPKLYNIDYILVPSNGSDNINQDAINIRYPNLYQKGADWCVLQREFSGLYKLYKVIKRPNKLANGLF